MTGFAIQSVDMELAKKECEDLFYQALHREVRAWVGEVSQFLDPREPADELLGEMALYGFQKLETSPLVHDLLIGKTRDMLPMWSDRFDELRYLGMQNVIEVLKLGIVLNGLRTRLGAPHGAC